MRRAAAAGLLQATTLTFVIVATQIGETTGKMTPTVAASLVAAGLLSAALFPPGAMRLLPRAQRVPAVLDRPSGGPGLDAVVPRQGTGREGTADAGPGERREGRAATG
jgi:hypothetical protein